GRAVREEPRRAPGFMSFFAKAAANALQKHPIVNSSVDSNDVIYHCYADISIAVATDKGLVTPVLRNVENMSFAEVEAAIAGYAKAAREGGLKLEDLQGGTFTITNGGTFGSLLSTPIVNPPQSAILGMHASKERQGLRPPPIRRRGAGAAPAGFLDRARAVGPGGGGLPCAGAA